ncbi:MAG: Rrf2 family transcriptional regulator [Deltaproteobacteria bacterium]|jgi:DNA-binding IscR family transcriptional regulator|nr:Rrf2 family transcriptional regulator [Deltaproteobacteria bacterium]
MRFSLKVSAAVHILLVAHFFSETKRITGRLLSKSTGCNPVVVRTLVLSLKNAGILEVSRGPLGGARLLKTPEEISLWDVYAAVDPESMDALVRGIHNTSSQHCPVGRWILDVLKGPYEKIAGVIEKEMRAIALADLASGFSADEIESFKEILSRTRTEDLPDRASPPD